mgnify:CR=1 FL=1
MSENGFGAVGLSVRTEDKGNLGPTVFRDTSTRTAGGYTQQRTMSSFREIAAIAHSLLKHPLFESAALQAAALPPSKGKQPYLPLVIEPPRSICAALKQAGCSDKAAEGLDCLFSRHAADLRGAYLRQFAATMEELAYDDIGDSWYEAVRRAFLSQYASALQRLQGIFREEVHAAQLRHSSSPPPPQPPATDAATTTLSGHFTPAITALLQSAYDANATGALPNKGERRELARATGLSEKQVVTWVSGRVVHPMRRERAKS